MSYLNFLEDCISLTEEECFLVEDASDYILSLTDEELDLLETTDIEYIMDFLEAVGTGYDNRFTNMFINHRQRDSYSHLMPGFRSSSPIYRASDQYQKHANDITHPAIKQLADKKESLAKLINLSKKKLGKNHPYVKAKKKEYRKLKRDSMNAMNGNPDRLLDRISMGKGTRKAIRKRYDLVNVPKNDDVLTDKEKKQVPQFGEDSKRGNPIDFEAHHKKMNKRAMQAKDRLERYLNGERKHLQRDKNGNVIKGKNGKAKVFYDKYDRDEKTGKIVGKAHEYSDEEYTKKHDENVSKRVNPARERLWKKNTIKRNWLFDDSKYKTVNRPMSNHNLEGVTNLDSPNFASKQYNPKTGKMDRSLDSHVKNVLNNL